MAPVLEACLDAAVVLGATRDCRPGLQKLWWAFERLDLPPLARDDAKALLWTLVDRDRIPDAALFEATVLEQAAGNPHAIVDMARQVAGEGPVALEAIRALQHGAGLRYLDLTPVLLLVAAGLVAARFVALGLDNRDLYILAGTPRRALLRGPRAPHAAGQLRRAERPCPEDPASGRPGPTLHALVLRRRGAGLRPRRRLQAIEQLGLRVTEVSGSSIGAFVAALVAAGYSAGELAQLGPTLRRRDFLRYAWPERRILANGFAAAARRRPPGWWTLAPVPSGPWTGSSAARGSATCGVPCSIQATDLTHGAAGPLRPRQPP